jgi:LPS-assembly lipoprotein
MDSDEVSNFTGYSTFGTPVATQAAERDAEARLMQMLADQMLTRLVAAAGMPPE